MTCEGCGEEPSYAIYMGIPMRVCFNHEVMGWGCGWTFRILRYIPFNGVFATYPKGHYLKGVYHWFTMSNEDDV